MNTQRKRIPMNANNRFCIPKKSIDHKPLRINCVKKKYIAILFFIFDVTIKYNEIPIVM